MPTVTHDQLSEFYRHLADSLDVPESYREKAEQRYKSVGKWLDREESPIRRYSPLVYAQGSFRLGTVVKPVSDDDHYDIDLVCELAIAHSKVTQKQLKHMVGTELKGYATAQGMKAPPEEGRRCWTLNYADGAQFHMDALPCIPETDQAKARLGVAGIPAEWAQTSIALTDTQVPTYDSYVTDWPKSNPKGYGNWFASRMEVILRKRKQELVLLAKYAKVEDVPDNVARTPLQRVVQILKRHRDIAFANDKEDRPVSIIITTLCAHAYKGEADLLDALRNVVHGMPERIQTRGGRSWVPNPVNPLENFADRWQEHPQREQKLRQWLVRLAGDIDRFRALANLHGGREELHGAFGVRAVDEALGQLPHGGALSQPRVSSMSTPGGSLLSRAGSAVLSFLNVPQRERPKWDMQLRGKVQVRGFYTRSGFRPQEFDSDGPELSKHWALRFEAETSLAGPFRVYWQVVNTGDEARCAGSLRGGFYDGLTQRGGLVRDENTLYRGKHWIECFIVKDGVCLARSGEFVVNIG